MNEEKLGPPLSANDDKLVRSLERYNSAEAEAYAAQADERYPDSLSNSVDVITRLAG